MFKWLKKKQKTESPKKLSEQSLLFIKKIRNTRIENTRKN